MRSSPLTYCFALFIGVALAITGCTSEQGVEAAREPDMDRTADRPNELWANETEFREYATEMHVGEINMAKLAKQKSSNPDVKSYADQVIAGHSDALKQLGHGRDHASIKPSMDTMNHVEDLSRLSGTEFDRMFVDLMIADHKDATQTFEEQLDATEDGEFHAYLENTKAILNDRLDAAEDLKDEVGKVTE